MWGKIFGKKKQVHPVLSFFDQKIMYKPNKNILLFCTSQEVSVLDTCSYPVSAFSAYTLDFTTELLESQ